MKNIEYLFAGMKTQIWDTIPIDDDWHKKDFDFVSTITGNHLFVEAEAKIKEAIIAHATYDHPQESDLIGTLIINDFTLSDSEGNELSFPMREFKQIESFITDHLLYLPS